MGRKFRWFSVPAWLVAYGCTLSVPPPAGEDDDAADDSSADDDAADDSSADDDAADDASANDDAADDSSADDDGASAGSATDEDGGVTADADPDAAGDGGSGVALPVVDFFISSNSGDPLPGGGGTVTLSWEVSGATELSLEVNGKSNPLSAGDRAVVVTVTRTTHFTLIAENAGGKVERPLTIEVSNQGDQDWVVQFGTPLKDYAQGLAVAPTGEVFVAGYTSGALDGQNAGSDDAFLTKYNDAGEAEWSRQWGSAQSDYARAVAVGGAGSVYVTGDTAGALQGESRGGRDAILAKYDDAGELQWLKQWGTAESDFSATVIVDPDDDVYVAGYTYAALDGENLGGCDAFLMKYSSAGEMLWTKQWGSTGADYGRAIARDKNGSVYVAGDTEGAVDGQNRGKTDAFLTKFSAAGELLWTKQWGVAQDDFARAVAVDGSGNAFVAGDTDGALQDKNLGSDDAYLTKYSSEGELLWTAQWGTTEPDSARAIALDDNGTAYVAGDTYGVLKGANIGGYDATVTKYSSEGELLWAKQWGSPGLDYVGAVVVDATGVGYLAGATDGALKGANLGDYDAFLIRFR